MNLYRVTYTIDIWMEQPVKVWAKSEYEAITLGTQTLIMAGHTMHKFKSLVKINK